MFPEIGFLATLTAHPPKTWMLQITRRDLADPMGEWNNSLIGIDDGPAAREWATTTLVENKLNLRGAWITSQDGTSSNVRVATEGAAEGYSI